MGQMTLPTVT